MKTYRIYLTIISIALILTSCFEDREVLFSDTQIEFEDAVMRARATGQIFPIIDVTRTAGTPNYQVNLIGAHLQQSEQVSFSTDEVPAALLNATTIKAVEGVHYTLNGNNFEFPTESSKVNFAGLTIKNDFPVQTGIRAIVIIKLDGNNTIKPAENYRRLAIRINLN